MLENILGASIALAGFLILIIVIYYFYSYGMVKKRKTYLVNMHESIQVGKRIIFAGGIFGKIVEINGDIITVEVKKGAHLEVSRYSVSEVLEKE
jgi:preprotein translocase subunit YajC